MRASIYILGAAVAYVSAQQQPEISAAPGSLPLGAQCSSNEQCANGAQCYGVTSMTITTCGSFQSACTSDDQCATNTCNQGFCNGPLASTTVSDPSQTLYIPTQSSVIAEPSSLPLGAKCSSNEQCANGAQCYGVAAWTITTCGSFQSACTSDDQCATNTCNQGFCNGEKSSSAVPDAPTTTTTGTETGTQPLPTHPSISAEPGTLPIGAQCSSDEQCANGAQCYGVTAWTIRTCGSFQSACTSDSQCATNLCNEGFCNGPLPSGLTTTTYPTGANNATGTLSPTSAPTYTGAASKMTVGLGSLIAAAVFALAL